MAPLRAVLDGRGTAALRRAATPVLVASALLVPGVAAAQERDRILVFGNSLSDTGNAYRISQIRPEGPIPPSPPYFEGRFSNGPVWVERLAPLIGVAPGDLDVRAFGGAETGLQLVPPGVQSQVIGFLAGGGRPGATDLAVVWGGGNDYRFNAGVADQAGLVARTVGNLQASVEALIAAGARDLLVPNLPDLGAIPEARMLEASQPGRAARLSALTDAHNQRLAAALEEIRRRNPGVTLRLLDVGGLFAAMQANPAPFGISNPGTPCLLEVPPGAVRSSGACATPEAAARTLFFDPVHPTATGHDLMGRYAASALAAPVFGGMGTVAQSGLALLAGGELGAAAGARLTALRAGLGAIGASALGPGALGAGPLQAMAAPSQGLDGEGAVLLAAFPGQTRPVPEASPMQRPDPDRPFGAFVYADRGWGDREPGPGRAGFDYRNTVLAVGADYRVTPALLLGIALGHGWGRASLDDGGSAELRSVKLGTYGSLSSGHWHLDFDAAYGFDDYPRNRRPTGFAPLPLAESETSGRTLSAGLNTGYDLRAGFLTVTPFAGARWQDIRIDGYEERGAAGLSLAIGDQEAETLTGSLGLRIAARIDGPAGSVTPHLRVAFQHEFIDDPRPVTAALGGVRTTISQAPGDRDYLVLGAGVSVALSQGLSLVADYEGTAGRGDGRDHSVFGRIRVRF
ncbi:autotransporter domain-containing protein [Arenibaculum pallidiluteum]|uniref:autotransporter domain-containing protein n=1 Tax=Arenibaculum pallidiluteum TaxID=2812559 RepID=UPI001A96DAA1|nr:autotransporter domain-containing protein [Arenibaculum pallidiluteum]